jgi:cell shape-determining protein MreD
VLLIYLLAMLQLGGAGRAPDIVLVLVLTAAVFEDRSFAFIVGFSAGLFLDCGNPDWFGSQMIIYLMVAFGVTLVRRLVYERTAYLLGFGFLALVVKHGLTLVLGQALPGFWQTLVSGLATLVLLAPIYRLIKYVFNYRWKVA